MTMTTRYALFVFCASVATVVAGCAIDTSAPDAMDANPRDARPPRTQPPPEAGPGPKAPPPCRPVFNDDGLVVEWQCPKPIPVYEDCGNDCGGLELDVTSPELPEADDVPRV